MAPFLNQIANFPSYDQSSEGQTDDVNKVLSERFKDASSVFDPSNITMGLGGAAMGVGAILPKPWPAGVTSGMFKPLSAKVGSVENEVPYVMGQLADLPINAKGPGTAFVDHKTGEAIYAPIDHAHYPLAMAALKQQKVSPINDVFSQFMPNAARVRWNRPFASGDPTPVGGYYAESRGPTIDIMPREIPESVSPRTRQYLESQSMNGTFDALSKKGMIPEGTITNLFPVWGGQ